MQALLSPTLLGLRATRRLFAPRAIGSADLIPWKDLEQAPDGAPGAWRAVGANPQFLIPRPLSAGWVRIRLKMTASTSGRIKLFADRGNGFDSISCLQNIEVGGAVDFEGFVAIAGPLNALRLDPLDGPGDFCLETLHIDPLTRFQAFRRAIVSKVQLLRKYWHTKQAIGRALRSLARGDFTRLWNKLFQGLNGPDFEFQQPYDETEAYEAWRLSRRLTDEHRADLRVEAAGLINPPLFSVLLTLCGGQESAARQSIESVLRQTYPYWELCIACAGPDSAVISDYAQRDCRIRFTETPSDAGMAASARVELAAASGRFVTFLDEGDELAEHALSKLCQAVVADPDLDMVYADEDRLASNGKHVAPFFKPGWSPESLLAWKYTGRPAVYRTARVQSLGGVRIESGSAYEYDLALRLATESARVSRVPDVLYHRRETDDSVEPLDEAARGALQNHLNETGSCATVERGALPGLHRVRFGLLGSPLVSIIIASACRPVRIREERTYYLLKCLESIQKSTWPQYEIIVLHGSRIPPVIAYALNQQRVVHGEYDAPFNWSRAMNQGAALARGQHLLFLNDDTEVITPDWLERLLEFSQQPAVGAVGAKLFFPSGRIQHAGVAVVDGRPQHSFYAHHGEHSGYFNNLLVPRNCSAVTGACLMTRADVFHSMTGFNEALPLNYNDVDYCLRLLAGDKRIVCTPYARLYHHELGTRPAEVRPEEAERMRQRWGESWTTDPYYNPNLSTSHFDYRIGSVETESACSYEPV